jgi:hypothetical protein
MNFLFYATIRRQGFELDYNIYEFRLQPGKYKAELTTPANPEFIKEIIFWKEKKVWKVQPESKTAQLLAETIGSDIELRYN